MKPRRPRNNIEVFPNDRTIGIADVAPSRIKQIQQDLADCQEIPMEGESAQQVGVLQEVLHQTQWAQKPKCKIYLLWNCLTLQ